MATDWAMKGYLLGACSCDWGCPCSYNARPTMGFCEGGYVWHITQGHFGGLQLDGLNVAFVAHSPGPLHEGNLSSQLVIDERANPAQRNALLSLCLGKEGGPWEIFASITAKWLEPVYAPFEVKIDGLHSRVKAGASLEVELAPIANPVTGKIEELQLRKPTGFTSTWADLGATKVLRITYPGLKYDHSGKYGEYSEFAYAPAAAAVKGASL